MVACSVAVADRGRRLVVGAGVVATMVDLLCTMIAELYAEITTDNFSVLVRTEYDQGR
jgi:hypothetical protein